MIADLVGARRAAADDLTTTVALGESARAEVVDERGGRWLLDHDLAREAVGVTHQRSLTDPQRLLVVGTIDAVVVGYASAHHSPTLDTTICMIEELYVRPEAREIGVADAMLRAVRAWAVETECAALESHVLPGNRAAKNFFERVGMVTRKMRVSTEL